MSSLHINRRNFVKSFTSAAALISFPSLVLGQTTRIRLEWQQFKTTTQYTQFLDAIKRMRASTATSSPSSWTYWVNAHVNYCPHGTSYFLAWHRGYLYYFEQELRKMYPTLTLPYWDYYKYSRIPAEFTDPATGNPLYVSRTGTNVYNALTLAPFASTVVNFQRGTSNAFETSIESQPHNPVHNLIGGEMANMTSPRDPIFFLHHCNIDRLWYAWVRSGGKRVPYTSNPYNSSTSNSYWAGSFRYGSTMTIERYKTYTPSWLGYDNANNTRPTSLPLSAKVISPFKLTQAQVPQFVTRPPDGNFPATAARAISATSRSLGGVASVGLSEASVSARLPLNGTNVQVVQNAVTAALSAPAQLAPDTVRSVKVVLENLQLLGAGAQGGYFYKVYINLPVSGDATGGGEKYLLGTMGPFEIAGASHHGSATLEFPATEVLSKFSSTELQEFTVSFERVSGENAPRGQVLRVGEIRIEVSTDAPWNDNP
ncbi:tyrosinase family protein|uniref:tyrosinase family protein n=1 Tax=Noviherbaspirillum sp. L7-7A TaxID=2850560 RepID=UPI001C2C7D09|nr:tyrosinase family protein [Noviherbaspirillum sp. L7-7A]MBV0881049.1 tyrosinase family protein [Noviherbaspirillum sp. L7-7A]